MKFAMEREFCIELTTVTAQGQGETLQTTHKWPGASPSWRQPDGQQPQVRVGLNAVVFDRRPDHLAVRFAETIGAELCASEDEYNAAIQRMTLAG